MNPLPILARVWVGLRARLQAPRWRILSGVSLLLVALLIASFVVLRLRQPATAAGAPSVACPASAATLSMAPPGVTLPVKIPAGEPRVVATVNGYPLCAVGLELRVEGILANHQQSLKQLQSGQLPPGALPPSVLATLKETPNQVRHDALTRMIQERLLLQEGRRLGLTASLSAARAMARQQLRIYHAMPASSPARASFEAYLRANHLTEQTFLTNPGILQGCVDILTIAAMRQRIINGSAPGASPTNDVSAYEQHLWQTGDVRVYLPAQLGW